MTTSKHILQQPLVRAFLALLAAIALLAPAAMPVSGFQGQGRFGKKRAKSKRRAVVPRRIPESEREIGELAKAVSALRKYRREIKSTLDSARRPLGPFQLEGKCSWCSSQPWWALGACVETTTRTVSNRVDFSATRVKLVQVLADADDHAAQFVQRYSSTEKWVKALPEFSRGFNRDADIILEIQEEIKAGNGPTEQQQQRVKQALDGLTATVEAAAETLTASSAMLVESLDRQSDFRESIALALAESGQAGDRELTRLTRQISADLNQNCANSVAQDNFQPIRDQFENSIQGFSSAFQTLEAHSRQLEEALAALSGALQSSLTELKAVSDLVSAAHTDRLGSFLATIHLNAAKKSWAALAAANN